MRSVRREASRARIRRQDRAVTDESWLCEFLQRAPFGVLGTLSSDQPFLTSLLFVFEESSRVIYLHSGLTGRMRTNIEHNPKVCFTASQMGRLLPAEEAIEFSVEYSSVVVFGRGSIVHSKEEAARALQLLLDKYFPHLASGRDYRPITEEELARTAVFKISIEDWSGKKKSEVIDYPGAFSYRF